MDDEQLRDLTTYISLQTVSSIKDNDSEMNKAAAWLKARMLRAGLSEAQILHPKGFYPSVLGELHVNAALPTLLLYGHYDVQPIGDAAAWDTPPFDLTAKGNYLYGRGACDNKGQNIAALFSIEELIKSQTQLRFNIKLLLEGNEEVGSKGLEHIFVQNKEALRADVVVGIDGVTSDPERPIIYYTSKGLAYYTLTVRGAERELHSGYYGGVAYNPATLLTHFITTVAQPNATPIPVSLRQGIEKPTAQERADIQKIAKASRPAHLR